LSGTITPSIIFGRKPTLMWVHLSGATLVKRLVLLLNLTHVHFMCDSLTKTNNKVSLEPTLVWVHLSVGQLI
jgi:hypothetical protein